MTVCAWWRVPWVSWRRHRWELEEKEAEQAVVRAAQPVTQRRMSATVATIVDVQSEAQAALEAAGEAGPDANMTAAERVAHARAMRRIPLVNAPNIPNQAVVGAMPGCIARLLQLSLSEDPEVVPHAVDALAVLALTASNRTKLGSTPGLCEQLVVLCRHADLRVARNATACVGNMSFNNEANQKNLGAAGGVEALVAVCASAMRQGNRRRSMLDQRRRSLTELRLRGSVQELAAKRAAARRASVSSTAGDDVPGPRGPDPEAGSQQAAGEGSGGEGKQGGAAAPAVDVEVKAEEEGIAAEVVHLERAVGIDIDVLENATAALATLTSISDDNARTLGNCGGVGVLVGLTTASITAEHEIIHANAAEALVNATRLPTGDNANLVRQAGVAPLVLLCGSQHVSVQVRRRVVAARCGLKCGVVSVACGMAWHSTLVHACCDRVLAAQCGAGARQHRPRRHQQARRGCQWRRGGAVRAG